MKRAALLIRIAIVAALLALGAREFTLPAPAAPAARCHTDSECAAAFPGTNGDPS